MLSVIFPSYNEEKCIEKAYTTVKQLLDKNGIDGEFIFVNDGSSDRTYHIISELA